jgi:hypothetical protein
MSHYQNDNRHKEYVVSIWLTEFSLEVAEAMYDPAEDGPEVMLLRNFFDRHRKAEKNWWSKLR